MGFIQTPLTPNDELRIEIGDFRKIHRCIYCGKCFYLECNLIKHNRHCDTQFMRNRLFHKALLEEVNRYTE